MILILVSLQVNRFFVCFFPDSLKTFFFVFGFMQFEYHVQVYFDIYPASCSRSFSFMYTINFKGSSFIITLSISSLFFLSSGIPNLMPFELSQSYWIICSFSILFSLCILYWEVLLACLQAPRVFPGPHSAFSTLSNLSYKCFYQFDSSYVDLSCDSLYSPVSPEFRVVICPTISILKWVQGKSPIFQIVQLISGSKDGSEDLQALIRGETGSQTFALQTSAGLKTCPGWCCLRTSSAVCCYSPLPSL